MSEKKGFDFQRWLPLFGFAIASYMLLQTFAADRVAESTAQQEEVKVQSITTAAQPVPLDTQPQISTPPQQLPAAQNPVQTQAQTPAQTYEQAASPAPAISQGLQPIAAPQTGSSSDLLPTASPSSRNNLVRVKTDVYDLAIRISDAALIEANLEQFPISTENRDPFPLMFQKGTRTYVLKSGFMSQRGPIPITYNLSRAGLDDPYYRSLGDRDELVVELEGTDAEGKAYTRQYIFERGSYTVQVRDTYPQDGAYQHFALISRDDKPVPGSQSGGFFGIRAYLGAAYFTDEDSYVKQDFADLREQSIRFEQRGGWIAMLQHYFVTAIVPPENSNNYYQLVADQNTGLYTLGRVAVLSPQDAGVTSFDFYMGPKYQDELNELREGLGLTVDYGFLWFIGRPLFLLLKWLFSWTDNWGVSIILLTFIIKLLFYPLATRGYASMANMRKLQPQIAALQDRYKDNRQELGRATMELYRDEKVNPLGGCLPMLVPMPVFIALYWVLLESVELRGAPFFGYLDNLASPDPYFILPILMGASMFFIQKLSPPMPNMDRTQQNIIKFMPVVFTVLFLWFPSGLVLYWLVNNVLSGAQQWYITKRILAT